MTDIMKLADDYANACADVREFLGANAGINEADGTWIASQQARAALQSAIEALQEENALLEGTLESRERNIAEMQAENERLKQDRDEWRDATIAANQNATNETRRREDMQEQRDTWRRMFTDLQSRLDAMGKGDAVGVVQHLHELNDEWVGKLPIGTPLYAAPKVLAPLTDEQIEQAVKTYGVSWTGYREDDHGFYTIPVLSPYHYQFARAIEAAHGIHAAKGGQHEDA